MNPKENYLAVMKGKKPDRLPVYGANISDFLQFYYGISAQDFVDQPDIHVDVSIKCVEEFKFASLAPVAYILFGCGPETGIRWKFLENSLPGAEEGVIKKKEDVERFKIPSNPSGYFDNYLQILKKLNNKSGQNVYLLGFVLGPFTIACFLRGLQETLIDPLTLPSFYHSYMQTCVEFSKCLGRHVLQVGVEGNALLEIFLSPSLMGPDYFHKHISIYDEEVCTYFRDQNLPNSFAPFMGKAGDSVSQQQGRYLSDYFFGTGESLEVIKKGMEFAIPGFPAMITLSGLMMATWPLDDIITFLGKALDFVVKEKKRYPTIRLTSLQPANKDEAHKMADKVRAINDLLDSCPI